ncbi:exopolygalacturonase clone GBGA483-like [Cucurbita pepo subsp. pepo]|uniref:exopolygalacturonase clone GBGA483-like n=1 Tax=Cucurbita pepo subsp. pepo TaxID=3664 RepID=UPI000C9D33D4|nr:exopolygalacturonase clone GBGA483-like [Cucurbita pepo subsp. pepo]
MSSLTISRSSTFIIFFSLCLITNGLAADFHVKRYGAKANGNSDDSQAIMKAWKDACMSRKPSKVVISGGRYVVNSMKFKGPCMAPVHIQMEGRLEAPLNIQHMKSDDNWIIFEYINGLTISGKGIFDGRGSLAWKQNQCASSGKCDSLPISLRFYSLNNTIIRGITSTDSKFFHMNVHNCRNMTIQNIIVNAPGISPNTDGIHIGGSSGVTISNARIETGDDCVSIGDGSQQIIVEKVTCGPGHGISIGSLGKYKNEKPVSGIIVRNCTIKNTMFGVRIKTWPDSTPGIATNMHFNSIVMKNVGTPILIDQQYCPYGKCRFKIPSRVAISDVGFRNIVGTSTTRVAVKLVCSRGYPCKNVKLSNINLRYIGTNGTAISECSNVKPTISGRVMPPACTRAFAI